MPTGWAPFAQSDSYDAGSIQPPTTTNRTLPSKMDLSDNFSYPMVASTDYSPQADTFSTFENPVFGDSQNYSLEDWANCDVGLFDRAVSSIELPAGFAPTSQAVLNATLPAAASATANANMDQWGGASSATNATSFGNLPETYDQVFSNEMPFNPIDATSFESSVASPQETSPTPSLCGDGSASIPQASPALSQSSLKRESPEDNNIEDVEPTPKRVQRKRGRPRIHRIESDPTEFSPKASRRLPHNQVERKYREGLNAELERLRRAVPTLPQRDTNDLNGPPKPSKATVLASAIDYIKTIEAERDRLSEENERLRGLKPSNVRARNFSWNKSRSDSTSSANMNS